MSPHNERPKEVDDFDRTSGPHPQLPGLDRILFFEPHLLRHRTIRPEGRTYSPFCDGLDYRLSREAYDRIYM